MNCYFGLVNYSDSGSNVISKRSCHCQTRNILFLNPDSKWANLFSIFISVGKDSSPIHLNPYCLSFVVCFVISGEFLEIPGFIGTG